MGRAFWAENSKYKDPEVQVCLRNIQEDCGWSLRSREVREDGNGLGPDKVDLIDQ